MRGFGGWGGGGFGGEWGWVVGGSGGWWGAVGVGVGAGGGGDRPLGRQAIGQVEPPILEHAVRNDLSG